METRTLFLVCLAVAIGMEGFSQAGPCTFKPPFYTMDFGRGAQQDVNFASLSDYSRVGHPCPSDGHYTYISSTSGCFRGDWHTLDEDHTPGDGDGNMLIVNSAYSEGQFFSTRVIGFKPGTTYQFGVWLMNVCRPSDKCPFPLLPSLIIRLQTPGGKTVAVFSTGQVPRVVEPRWTQHRAEFTMPATERELLVVMQNTSPGGCGNDFAMDDITFRECVRETPRNLVVTRQPLPTSPQPKPVVQKKKDPPVKKAAERKAPVVTVTNTGKNVVVNNPVTVKPQPAAFVPAPPVLRQRASKLVNHIETPAGELRFDLYDNGEIDGDTVSIYHNNILIVSRQVLSQKPITFRIQVDGSKPHHELVMVANNLGSIPPNTSMMIVTARDKRYEVFISSTEQTNAKVVVSLKE